jgi:hypothetical protein
MINYKELKSEKKENIFNIVIMALFCFSFIKNISNSIGSTISFIQLFIINIVIVSIFVFIAIIINKIKHKLKFYSSVVLILNLVYLLIVYIYYSNDYFNWIVNFLYGDNKIDKTYLIIFTIMVNLLISGLAVLFIYMRFNFYIILLSGITMYFIQVINDIVVDVFSLYLYIFIILIYFFKYVYNNKKLIENNSYTDYSSFSLLTVPLCLIIVLIIGISASDKDFIKTDWYEEKINYISELIFPSEFDPTEYFDLNSTGFGESNKLGGDVKLKDNKVMEVHSTKKLYLRGVVKDTYSDNTWSQSDNEFGYFDKDKIPIDTNLQIDGINKYSKENLFSTLITTIDYNEINTKIIFHPMNVLTFYTDIEIMKDENNTIISKEFSLENGFEYSVKNSYLNYSNNNVKDILRKNSYQYSPSEIYLQLPKTLPSRIEKKSIELTKTYDNSFDKVKAIENYLQNNYAYTLIPGNVPEGEDFVDYFLFESQKGYCTYFATSFVVMCRSIGIPARYIEGYIFPKEAEKKNLYYITNQQAHAWSEVYFDNFGWVMFEPTTGFSSNLYGNYGSFGNYDEEFIKNPDYKDYIQNLDGVNINDNTDNVSIKKSIGYVILKILLLFLIIIFIVISIFIINNLRKKIIFKKIATLEPNNSVLEYYKYYINILKYFKLDLMNGETPIQFSKRVDSYFKFGEICFIDITNIFLIARYSNNKIKLSDKNIMKEFNIHLLKAIKKRVTVFNYYFDRYILGKY